MTDYTLSGRPSRCRREPQDGFDPQTFPKYPTNHQVAGSEVVRPLRDTMGLVDAGECYWREFSQERSKT